VEHDDVEPKDDDEVTSEVERFANDFFTYPEQKNQCPKLRAGIFGMHWDPKIPHDLVRGDESLCSRQCFVKEHQNDASNRRKPVACRYLRTRYASSSRSASGLGVILGGHTSFDVLGRDKLVPSWRILGLISFFHRAR
jgi:hypothetical protein